MRGEKEKEGSFNHILQQEEGRRRGTRRRKKDKEKEAFEFYPGSGAGDHTAKNIINVPLMPMWRLAGSGLSQGD